MGSSISLEQSDKYKAHVYFATKDVYYVMVSEMKARFNDLNTSLMISLDSLNPKSKSFLSRSALGPILSQYSHVLPQGNVDNEISTFKNYLEKMPKSRRLRTVWSTEVYIVCFESIDLVKQAFLILRECLMIAMTLGTSTAIVERSFSSLRRLKPYLRTTMSQQRLGDLAILYIKDLSSRLWSSINDLVIKFAQVHNNSKIVL